MVNTIDQLLIFTAAPRRRNDAAQLNGESSFLRLKVTWQKFTNH